MANEMRVLGGVRKEGEKWTSTCHVYYSDGTKQTWVFKGHNTEEEARQAVKTVLGELQEVLGTVPEQEYAN